MTDNGAAEFGLSIRELISYTNEETQRWFDFFRETPQALTVEIGGRERNVHGLVLHIISVEYRYAERLLGKEPTPHEQFAGATFAQLRDYYAHSRSMLERVLATSTGQTMADEIVSQTRSFGEIRASRRKVMLHMLLHGVRHWAQIATALRQSGYKTWPHDIAFSKALE